MPRSAADVRRVIKAYDVRGLVGAEPTKPLFSMSVRPLRG